MQSMQFSILSPDSEEDEDILNLNKFEPGVKNTTAKAFVREAVSYEAK